MKANDMRGGNGVKIDGKLYVVVKTEHTKPGKGPAYIQAKLKDAITGANIERRFGSAEDVEDVTFDRREMEYLYSDPSGATFMDTEDYDQKIIPAEVLGDALLYLVPNTTAHVVCYEENPIIIELPASVEVTVSDTALEIGDKEYKAGDAIPPLNFELNGATFSQQLFVGSLGSIGFLNDPCLEPGLYESIAEGEAPSSKGCTWEKICMPLRPACTEEEGFEWCEFQGAPELFFDAPKSTPTNGGCQLKGSIHMKGGLCYTCA